MFYFIELLKAALYGILEGITEWLPVSSTGHLILLNEFLGLQVGADLGEAFTKEYWDMFEVVIQLGAILAVIVLFWHKLNPFSRQKNQAEKKAIWNIWGKVLVASIPAAVVGILADKLLEHFTGKDFESWLYNGYVVAIALIVYGIAFILVERLHAGKTPRVQNVEDITYSKAFCIGAFQMLSIVPGTSRSGSTILGGILLGLSRRAAAEFSFFMAIPAMLGASLLKGAGFAKYVMQNGISVPAFAWVVLLVACLVAFLVSMLAIRFLMDFVKRHSFAPFGWYRITLGAVVLGYFLARGIIAA